MLELNKEYTYKEIIEILEWEEKGGNSKKAQINEIESAYEFYHPMNKKTHKEKKSYIFTKKLRELVEPSMANSAGNNTKNIKPMIEYMQSVLSDDICNGEYHSMTSWLCDILELLDKELCNTVYCGDDAIIAYCEKHGIHNRGLLVDYVSEARRTLKGIFLKSLENMEKNELCEYFNGYIFIYQMSSRKIGFFATHILNEVIIANEISICNELNKEHHLSEKMKGRQLLMQIYSRKNLTEMFNELKILELMGDDEAIKQLNKVMECDYGASYTPVDADHPLINYYGGVAIPDMEFVDMDNVAQELLRKEICSIVKDKTRKAILNKGNKSKLTNERYFIYNELEHGAEIEHIAKLLFVSYTNIGNVLTDDDIAEMDELFDIKASIDTDHWGEPDPLDHDFSVEEILDMPTVSEVTASDLDIETDKVGINDLEDDDILPWMQDSDLQSKDTKIVLSREEAEELFA